MARSPLLPYAAQTTFRDQYRAARPGWMSSGDQFDLVVRKHLTPESAVLDLGCGRTGGIERFWREARVAVGVDPDLGSLVARGKGLRAVRAEADGRPDLRRCHRAPVQGGDADRLLAAGRFRRSSPWGSAEAPVSLGTLRGPLPATNSVRDRLDELFRQRIVIFDGSVGVLIQRKGLTEEDFRGERFKNHPRPLRNDVDVLCLTRPDLVAQVHRDYLEAGAD